MLSEACLLASVVLPTSLLPAQSLMVDGWPSAFSLIPTHSIHLITQFHHFQLLNVSHVRLLFSSPTSAPMGLVKTSSPESVP